MRSTPDHFRKSSRLAESPPRTKSNVVFGADSASSQYSLGNLERNTNSPWTDINDVFFYREIP